MKYIIDTHVLLWSLGDTKKLSSKAREILQESIILVSVVSWWEISLKFAIGKLELKNGEPEDLWIASQKMKYELLPISAPEANSFHRLEIIHRDPFDRMIVWQAIKNNLPLLSKDNHLAAYEKHGLQLLW